jgi:hypothetical protein
MDRPVVCTLGPSELAARREALRGSSLTRVKTTEPIPGGLRLQFEPEPDLVARLAAVIDAERQCCRFLRFTLQVEPEGGPVWLELTGPEGTAELISALLQEKEVP